MVTAKRMWRSHGKSPRHTHAKTTKLRTANGLTLQRSQRTLNRGGHFRRVRSYLRLKAREDLPVRSDQKLRKIPLNISAGLRIRRFVRQKLIQRRLVVALHRNFGHHWELHVVFGLAEGIDLLVRARLLRAKIIRGNSHDHESPVLVLLI